MHPKKNPARRLLLLGFSLAFGLAFGHASCPAASSPESPAAAAPGGVRQPNILFLLADDLACDGVHAFGGGDVKTPNLDKLAARGAMFTEAHNMGAWNGAVCIASRAMLITGRTLWHAKAVAGKPELAAENAAGRLWPGMMKAAGYQTFMTGKWHNEIPPRACFDIVRVPRVGVMPSTVKSAYKRPPADGAEDVWNPADTSLGGYWQGGRHWTEVAAETAIGFIQEHAVASQTRNTSQTPNPEPHSDLTPSAPEAAVGQAPYFAYVAFNAPHDPRQSPQEFLDLYKTEDITVPENFLPVYPFRDAIGMGPALRDEALAPFPRTPQAVQVHRREYYALISHLDAWVGKILEAVEKSGEASNTLIIFTADHGLALGRHGFMGKQSLYEHSTKVPLILTGPGIPAGTKVAAPVYLQDAMATALEAARASKPEHVEFESLLPLLKPDASNVSGRGDIYGADLERQRSFTSDGWKIVAYPKVPVLRFYHLAEDPLEVNDLAAKPELAELLRNMFEQMRLEQITLDDPLDLGAIFPAMENFSEVSRSPAGQAADKAAKEFIAGYFKLGDAYRLKMAEAVSLADRVEVFHLKASEKQPEPSSPLDPFDPEGSEKLFSVAPYGTYARIVGKVTADKQSRDSILPKIKDMLEHPGTEQAMCHDPAHGIRVYVGDSLIFETSLCYHCRNFYLKNPVDADWLGLPDNGLRELLQKLLPLPPEKE